MATSWLAERGEDGVVIFMNSQKLQGGGGSCNGMLAGGSAAPLEK